ncbi:hypothetical protein Vadar_020755 [Vaccinium darrowii]|uniref:Uncharacterized protein n=1 Tax=Vaccinium darrowii TaxID=229202 RepID=A0ACB7X333_9ERIC|nr:hypothetical protein Vadar_020755 [Vaccinium darrowii]
MSDGHIHPTSLEEDSGAAFCSFEDSSTSPVMENLNEVENCANNVIPVEDNTLDNEVHEEENNPFEKKGRKRTSEVWKDFEEISLPDGTKKYQCKSCKTKFTIHASGVTSHLRRHMNSCLLHRVTIGQEKRQKTLSFETIGSDSGMSLGTFSYDQAKVREAASHMILYHEYPFNKMEHVLFNKFMRTATPYWQKISRATAKNDCVSTYQIQKKKLKTSLRGVHRIGLTTDLWKSTTQKIQYMVVTGHFMDDNWKLQKRVLNFCNVPPPHTGVIVADALYKSIVDWGIEDKVSSITVDNATYNDVALRNLKATFELLNKKMLFDGAALDPRYKMKRIDCCFPEIYTAFEAAENSSVVLDSLHELYKEYVAVYSLANIEQNSSSKEVGNSGVASYGSKKMGSGRSKFDSFVRKVDSIQPVKSELDIYLEEDYGDNNQGVCTSLADMFMRLKIHIRKS